MPTPTPNTAPQRKREDLETAAMAGELVSGVERAVLGTLHALHQQFGPEVAELTNLYVLKTAPETIPVEDGFDGDEPEGLAPAA